MLESKSENAAVAGGCAAAAEGYVEHYNDVRLNSAIGYITPKDMLPAVSRRSMLSEIGSWRRHENSVRFVGGKPREEGNDKPIFADLVNATPNRGSEHRPIRGVRQRCAPGADLFL